MAQGNMFRKIFIMKRVRTDDAEKITQYVGHVAWG